jgi:hypothetical protein
MANKKKLVLEFLDNRDKVVKTHEFNYEVIAGKGARIRVTLNGKTFFLEDQTPEPDWKDQILEQDDKQWATEFVSEDKLIPSWTVSYKDPNAGNKGEAVYMTVSAGDEQQAKTAALSCSEFSQHITPEFYDARYLKAYPATGNYVIGKVQYFQGDPRL